MTDRIFLKRLAVYGYHGLLPEEAVIGQRFYISLEARLDLAPAGVDDDFSKTVSYADLAEIAHDLATKERFEMIEALAEAIASKILLRFAAIDSLVVTVEKPSAPVPYPLESIAVEIERSRHG
ncbi:Dihydroneopterin aldolase [Hartmannibacter diazotrophicus]|uniref:7,8-dihydroneopterin aldolase n=1 Tax=Hartmannibacter diazotrophicus TaxID=1482074 RepID=A0A2C9D7W7_9HYPH|nr:dihydroneopterin aldolase [Hartmannibacter diazotrophicus]SON55841.1 Dihydroneopterin aldolase [Hartmannibacter diazotrophicus]